MERLFIDESGSMTVSHCTFNPYFIICIVRANNPDAIKRAFKRFIKSNLSELMISNDTRNGTMFRGDSFVELKGNAMTEELKHKFVDYFCRNNDFEIFCIVCDNSKIIEKTYSNTARAFNYILRLAIEFYIKHDFISGDGILLQLDERNERTDTKYFLENYLNTELYLSSIMQSECRVQYFDSSNNILIQIADVFANLYFSEMMTDKYTNDLNRMKKNGYLKHIFKFPLH